MFKLLGAAPRKPGEQLLRIRVDGFDGHASTAFEVEDRVASELSCRHGLRAPIADGRLTRGPRSLLTCRLERPDGLAELARERPAPSTVERAPPIAAG